MSGNGDSEDKPRRVATAATQANDAAEVPARRPWRTGSKVQINVYEGDRPICQCQTAMDAALIVRAVNRFFRNWPRPASEVSETESTED